ncbi:hypothetical protein [Streptomyces sedi]|uniref:Uncharacterized protein n=1 Tax=Streptomyces sedi TaxID=555059 RepID=A0A5C4V040_9ACTN|nr:hypothetical protein [Streptomyces sedi]TNM29380.1 hypothetical protein FH715_14635 [Streptomyces sedi]
MMVHLRRDEIDLDYDGDEPLRLVAEMERAVRRHGITMTDIGLDSRYLDMYCANTNNVVIELGPCRGDHLEKLISVLNAAPVEEPRRFGSLPPS